MTKKITQLLVSMLFAGSAIAQPAAPTISGSTIYCEGQTISLTASSPAAAPTYTWTGPAIAGSFSGATLTIPGATNAMNGVYTATVTSGGLTSGPSSVTIVINNKPPVPYASPDVYNYCQGNDATPLAAIGANLLWYTTPTGGVGSAVTPTPSTGVPGSTNYYVSQTVNGCESDRKVITVNVIAKPPMPSVKNNISYCQNSIALPLQASGNNLQWYLTSSGGIGSTISPTPVTSYAGISYYYVTQTINGCESDRAQIMVTVNFTPNALIVASVPQVCQHDTMSFSYFGNASATSVYNWSFPPGTSLVSGSGQGPLVLRFDQAGQQAVRLTVDNNGCKSPLTTYVVKVQQLPNVPVVIKKDACQNEVVNISIGYANEMIDQYSWNFDGGNVKYGSEGGPYGVSWSLTGTYIVGLTAVTNGCPSVTITDTINIHPLPDAGIGSVSDNNICAGDSVAFTAERYNPGYLYQWLPAGYFGNITNLSTVYGYIAQPGYVYLQVTSEYGCTAKDSTLVNAKPCCDVYFPNAFTPNGDGKNDVFRPITVANQKVKTFTIIDRWGQKMFETTDIKQGWDGTFNGKSQDMDTYFYFISYTCANGKNYEKKGEVLLVR